MQWIKRAWRGEEKLWKAFYYSMGFIFLVGGVYGGAAGYFIMEGMKKIRYYIIPLPRPQLAHIRPQACGGYWLAVQLLHFYLYSHFQFGRPLLFGDAHSTQKRNIGDISLEQ